MTDFLLKLFGLRVADPGRVSRAALAFHGLNPLYLLLAGMAILAAVVWMYRRAGEDLRPLRRYALAILRGLFLLLILGLLARPVLSITVQSHVRRTLLVMLDTSASMDQILDQRSDTSDLKRLAIARNILDPAKGLGQTLTVTAGLQPVSRLELVKSVLRNPRLNLMSLLAREYDLAVFTFDRSATEIVAASYRAGAAKPADSGGQKQSGPGLPMSWLESLKATGDCTAIGDALQEVIARKRGQPLAGVLLVTDGASNSGLSALDAAEMAGRDGLPLYIYGVGVTSPRDIVVSAVFAPDVAFVGDRIPVTVQLRSMGLAGHAARMVLQMGQQKTETDVSFNADGQQLVSASLTPQAKGDYDIRAYVPPRDDEVVKDNNACSQRIRIIDSRIKVLCVEQSPRWEFKYLQAALMRDRRIDPRFLLFEADPELSRYPASVYIAQWPASRQELFQYDVVILGDVDPAYLTGNAMDGLHDFVSRFGGSLIVLAGKRYTPGAYRSTPVGTMLPVEVESAPAGGVSAGAFSPIRLELTGAGKASPMLRLAETEADNVAIWKQLPPVYWDARVARAKPAAEVLVVDPDPAKASRYGQMPVVAMQQYGLGQVLYVGTDNLWRWRKNAADRYHTALWVQMVQRMALPRLLGASKRTQLTSDQKSYAVGSRVMVFARLYTEAFEPMSEPTVRATCTIAGQTETAREIILRAIPDRPGMYRGEFFASAPGDWRLTVDHDRSTWLDFAVTELKQELAETGMNESLLRQMAQRSGGAVFREEDLHMLPAAIGARADRLESNLEVEIWASPFYFLLMVLVVTAEWILRKMSQLK